MKVLAVIPYLASTYGGTSKSVKELAREVSNHKVSLDLITTNAGYAQNFTIPVNTWLNEKNYRLRYFPCWHHNDFIVSIPLISWLFKHISRYDLVHNNTMFAPLISITHKICQLKKIPYIVTPHGMLEPWALSYKARKKQYYYNLVEKASLAKAKAIQTLASSEAKNLQSLGFKQTIVVPNGIDTQEYQELPTPEIFYQQFPHTRNKTLILFLGRIDPKKGLDLLASAFARAYRQFPNIHLIVAGPDSINFFPTVRNYFVEAGCIEAVTFTGMIKGSLKYAALAAAKVYIAPSYSEGFSMSILEGMVSGLPCIITKGCNFPEAATAQAARVVDMEPEAIASALIECLQNPDRARAMGDRARQFILDNYTWDKIAAQMKEVYQAIADNQSIPVH